MEIVIDYPPIYDELKIAFPRIGRGVIFAWGDKIYNPSNVKNIAPQLIIHERAHARRQRNDVLGWWNQYIADKEFRLVEETIGHIAEMKCLLGPNPGRQVRRQILASTAKRLTSPLYRYGISRERAKILLKEGLVA